MACVCGVLVCCAQIVRNLARTAAYEAVETAVDVSVAKSVNESMEADKKQKAAAEAGWKCTQCGTAGNHGNFCVNCGAPNPANAPTWDCAACGQKGNKGNFCAKCGAAKPADAKVEAETQTPER